MVGLLSPLDDMMIDEKEVKTMGKQSRLTTKFKKGKPPQHISHGGYSFLASSKLPERRKHVLKYLTAARDGLVMDLGPTEEDLTTAQIILIDRITVKLGVLRCIEEHIRETAVMAGDRLAASLRESYLAYNNSIRISLVALGLDKKAGDHVRTPLEIAQQVDKENAAKAEKETKARARRGKK